MRAVSRQVYCQRSVASLEFSGSTPRTVEAALGPRSVRWCVPQKRPMSRPWPADYNERSKQVVGIILTRNRHWSTLVERRVGEAVWTCIDDPFPRFAPNPHTPIVRVLAASRPDAAAVLLPSHCSTAAMPRTCQKGGATMKRFRGMGLPARHA